MAGRDILRLLWSYGVRVTRRSDGTLALIPSQLVTPELRQLATDAKPEITAIVAGLPAPNRCAICGAADGWNDGMTQTRCVACAQIAADRVLAELETRPRKRGDIAHESVA